MKTAVILSARKDKDTEIPYPLKPYYENSCLIDRTIEALTALNYDNILLVVGGQAQLYQRYASETVRLVLNPDFKFTSSMGSLAMAAPYIKDNFLLVEGDTFYEYKVLKELSETKNENCFAITEESGSGDEAFVETRSGYIIVWMLGRHWNVEAELGAGYAYTRYDKFRCVGCGKKLERDKSHHYVGPTKLAVNLVYVF